MRYLEIIDAVDKACELGTSTGNELLYRYSDLSGTVETLWLNSYPQIRRVIATFPPVPLDDMSEAVGVIREIPMRRNAEPADMLASVSDSYVRVGWTRADIAAYPALRPAAN